MRLLVRHCSVTKLGNDLEQHQSGRQMVWRPSLKCWWIPCCCSGSFCHLLKVIHIFEVQSMSRFCEEGVYLIQALQMEVPVAKAFSFDELSKHIKKNRLLTLWTRASWRYLPLLMTSQARIQRGSAGGARPPHLCAKFFKKSPKLAKNILGASSRTPCAPSFFKSWIRPCLLEQ